MIRSILIALLAVTFATPALAGFGPEADAEANAKSHSSAGAAAGAISGSKSGVKNSGNSHVGVGVYAPTKVNTDVDASSKNYNHQGQHQGQGQGLENTVEGDSTYVEGDDFRFPASQAPASHAGECNQGIGGQGIGGGGSIATGNPVCDWRIVHGMALASGDKLNADWATYQARKAAEHRSLMSKVRSILTLGLL